MACERSSRFRNITTEAPFCEFEGLRLSAYHLLPSYATFFALSNFFFWRTAIFVNIGRNGSDAGKPEKVNNEIRIFWQLVWTGSRTAEERSQLLRRKAARNRPCRRPRGTGCCAFEPLNEIIEIMVRFEYKGSTSDYLKIEKLRVYHHFFQKLKN